MQHVPQHKRYTVMTAGPATGVVTAGMMSMILWLSVLVLMGF